ncbi:MAG: DUF2845 domain-containing protein [Piscirickettsiaceae bacterium]|nr:DUF2845 domain-containing protein [Piscirickettsiaceae bacterium]
MLRVIAGSFILLMFSFNAFAGDVRSLRCGNGFIKLGMNSTQVKKACSSKWQPANIERYSRQDADPRVRYSDGTIPVNTHLIEKWTYKFYGKFITHVYFEDGRIKKIFETSKRR